MLWLLINYIIYLTLSNLSIRITYMHCLQIAHYVIHHPAPSSSTRTQIMLLNHHSVHSGKPHGIAYCLKCGEQDWVYCISCRQILTNYIFTLTHFSYNNKTLHLYNMIGRSNVRPLIIFFMNFGVDLNLYIVGDC